MRMKFHVVLKQFQLNILVVLSNEVWETRETIAVLLTASEKSSILVYSNMYVPVWFILRVMIDSVQLYCLFLALVMLTAIECGGCEKVKNFCASYLTVETCWFDQPF